MKGEQEMDEFQRTRKIVHLPGTLLTPEIVLQRTLEKIKHIKGIVVVIQWDDDSFATDWSSLKLSELCMASAVFAKDVQEEL